MEVMFRDEVDSNSLAVVFVDVEYGIIGREIIYKDERDHNKSASVLKSSR